MMNKVTVNNAKVPLELYNRIQHRCICENKEIANSIRKYVHGNYLIFGDGLTGNAIKNALLINSNDFIGYIDSLGIDTIPGSCKTIILGTHPVHYETIIESIRCAHQNPKFNIVKVFSENNEIEIKCVVESQPRSGTDYTMRNLMGVYNWGYASTFFDRGAKSIFHRLSFKEKIGVNGYVAKTHFTTPLYYPEYRYVKTIYLISYIYDSYYSWGKMLANGDNGYRLLDGSKEWQVLKGYIALNKKWLEFIKDKFIVKYEDYYINFTNTVDRIKQYIGGGDIKYFALPIKNRSRLFWGQCDWTDHFDRKVFDYLKYHFRYPIRCFWGKE